MSSKGCRRGSVNGTQQRALPRASPRRNPTTPPSQMTAVCHWGLSEAELNSHRRGLSSSVRNAVELWAWLDLIREMKNCQTAVVACIWTRLVILFDKNVQKTLCKFLRLTGKTFSWLSAGLRGTRSACSLRRCDEQAVLAAGSRRPLFATVYVNETDFCRLWR